MPLKRLLGFTCTAACVFVSVNCFAQLDTAAISGSLNRMKDKLSKDAVLLLYKDGQVIYKKEMGEYTLKTKVPVGAASQWITAALVMTFVQDGAISLDDKVSRYLPEFAKYFKSYITIRHCLTHFTGVKAEENVGKVLQSSKFGTLEEEANDIAAKHDIQTNPGTEFRYTNIGYNILGRVLEVVGKRSFDRLVQDRITRPLQMKNTTFTNDDYNSATNPSAGAMSSANDLAIFMGMLLEKGTVNGKKILTPESVEMLESLQVEPGMIKYAPRTVAGLPFGMGAWIMDTTPSGKIETIGAPSLKGSWPMLDLCRHYAFVLIAKNFGAEQDRKTFINLKGMIDEMMPEQCQ